MAAATVAGMKPSALLPVLFCVDFLVALRAQDAVRIGDHASGSLLDC